LGRITVNCYHGSTTGKKDCRRKSNKDNWEDLYVFHVLMFAILHIFTKDLEREA
jgi:hypothetical protein